MIDSILLIFTIAGIFSVVDSLTSEQARTKMSEYIFGVHGLTARHYEIAVMEVWLSLFVRDGKVSLIRVTLLSTFITLVICLLSFLAGGAEAVFGESGIIGLFAVMLWMCFCGAPIEYLNIRISKIIYIDRYSHWTVFAKFVADFIFSVVVVALFLALFYVIIAFFPEVLVENWKENLVVWTAYVTALVTPLLSMVAFLLVRAVVLISGAIVRCLFIISNINLYAAVISNAANVPMTYLSLILTTLYFVLNFILGMLQ